MQGLGGLLPGLSRGATMSGNKAGGAVDASPMKLLAIGEMDGGGTITATFTAAKAGLYQFVAWGGGGNFSGTPGGGGALAIRTVRLAREQSVAYTVGGPGSPGVASTVTFIDRVMSAGGGIAGGAGGTATGGDINVNGSAAVGSDGGTAGSSGAFVGGTGTPTGGAKRYPPGAGGFSGVSGAPGLLMVTYVGA